MPASTPNEFARIGIAVHAEVLQALRGLERGGRISSAATGEAIDDLLALRLAAVALEPLIPRVFALRHNATSYDALYLAAAEHLGLPLVTLDRKLAAVPGIACLVEVIG